MSSEISHLENLVPVLQLAFEGLEKSASNYDRKAFETPRGPKMLSFDLFTLCSLRDLWAAYLRPHPTFHWPSASKGTGWLSTRKVLGGSNHFAHAKHWGRIRGKKKAVAVFVILTTAYGSVSFVASLASCWGFTCKAHESQDDGASSEQKFPAMKKLESTLTRDRTTYSLSLSLLISKPGHWSTAIS